jgi:hypothetical protein
MQFQREPNGHLVRAPKKFQRGIALFNAHKFFEAHEVWEELWLRETGGEKIFLQGLIQLAAAFHHYSCGNWRGAKSLLAAGIVKLGRYPRNYHGLALTKFLAGVKRWPQMLSAGRDPGLQKLPQIRRARSTTRKKDSGRTSFRRRRSPAKQ